MRSYIDNIGGATIAVTARLRLPQKYRAGAPQIPRIAVVRSTSLGDFVVWLPFLTTLVLKYGAANVDLLQISRRGDIADLILGKWPGRVAVIDPSGLRALVLGWRSVRSSWRNTAFARVYYATQNSMTIKGRTEKLLLMRAIFGPWVEIVGFRANHDVQSRSQLEHASPSLAVNQAYAPFIACCMEPNATRSEVFKLLGFCAGERDLAEAGIGALLKASDGPVIAVYPHAKDSRKRWPIGRFVECAKTLHREYGARFVFVGGEEDREAAEHVASQLTGAQCAVVAGHLSVRETICALALCDAFLGNDGAPMHLASLAGLPSVNVFCAWEAPGLWEPIMGRRSLSIRPDWSYRRKDNYGIDAIPAHIVLAEMHKLLNGVDSQQKQNEIVVVKKGDVCARMVGPPPALRNEGAGAIEECGIH